MQQKKIPCMCNLQKINIFLTKPFCVTGLVRYLHSAINAATMRKALKDGDCPPSVGLPLQPQIFKPTNTSTVNQTGNYDDDL